MTSIVERFLAAGLSEAAARSKAARLAEVEAVLDASGPTVRHRFHVPGRIEVLGKHTDYAGGRSLLCAVERGFVVASAPREDAVVRIHDLGRGEEVALSLDPSAGAATSPHWAIYPAAMVRRLHRDFGGPLYGADIVFSSDLPPSSGLSSSSALLIATFEALALANDLEARADFRAIGGILDVAAYLGSVESGRPFRNFSGEAGVGTSGGSQDHTAILASEAGRLKQFSFSPALAEESAALASDLTFVIGVSGVVAQKTAGAREAYNRAAALTATLVEKWRTITGRADATLGEAMRSGPDAYPRLLEALAGDRSADASALAARLGQFVDETLVLIPAAKEAMGRGDLAAFGRAVDRSQKGAEVGLGNQVEETIELQRRARSLGAHAASAFGAGFGGSVWALVSRSEATRFREEWERAYRKQHSHPSASFFETAAGPPLFRLHD